MKEQYCQSCGMPFDASNALYGTNADGGINNDYCAYCFEKGKFRQECTMSEMIAFCVPHMVRFQDGVGEEQAKELLEACFPTLKRWKTS